MKYSIVIGKIVEGALKRDIEKVVNYTEKLITDLEEDNEVRSAEKFKKMLIKQKETMLTPMGINKEINIPVDTESRTPLADVVYPSDNKIEVILSKNNEERLSSFVLSYKNADKLNELGIGVTNTLLLYGPPGCGKTKCAYLIAKELNLPLVIARLDSLISSYLGTTSKNIRALFEFVQKIPCVLFLDEFDAIAKARDDNNELGELKRVVNSLLQNVDMMSNDSLLLAATNHEKLLDTAVWRRFNQKLEIELPDKESIVKMLEMFIAENLQISDKEKLELATVLTGLSGANIEEIIKKAIRHDVIYDRDFTKSSIYNEYFSFINLVPQGQTNEKEILSTKANYLREVDEKMFSYAVIATALGISKSSVSNLIVEGEKNE